ncbi:MAG: hypothetical protein GY940_17875 [bacterium]|nr:hypothetical protein [bacterium]
MVSEEDFKEEKNMMQWAFEKYREGFDRSDSMVRRQIEKRFAKFIKRPVLTEPMDCHSLNGCCLPGKRKNYITTGGDIHICEKMPGNCPPIGHVDTGFDLETIKKVYIDDYAGKSIGYCSGCWAIRICDVCYAHSFNDGGEMDMEKKCKSCRSVLNTLEQSLCNFITLMEENPGKLDYLNQYDIK